MESVEFGEDEFDDAEAAYSYLSSVVADIEDTYVELADGTITVRGPEEGLDAFVTGLNVHEKFREHYEETVE